jgi:hypothetical protein
MDSSHHGSFSVVRDSSLRFLSALVVMGTMTGGSLLRAHGIHGLNRTVEEPKVNEILTVSLESKERKAG